MFCLFLPIQFMTYFGHEIRHEPSDNWQELDLCLATVS
jgi:hypothetical protein